MAEANASARKLRVGLISAAWGAYAHLPAWRALDDVEVVAICTSRQETAEKAAREHGIERAFWDHREMSRDPQIDIVDCGTRPDWRREMVLAALDAGKHVYNGIPFSESFESSRRLHEAWRRSGRVGCVDAFCEWVPAYRRMREMIDEGFLGTPFVCQAQFQLSLFNKPRVDFPYNWFQHGEHGCSALRNLGSHLLHSMLYLFGEVESVIGHDARYLPEWSFEDGSRVTPQSTDTAVLMLRFTSGMIATVQPSWVSVAPTGCMIEVNGSAGRLRLASEPPFPQHLATRLFASDADALRMEEVQLPADLRCLPNGSPLSTVSGAPESASMAWAFHDMLRAIREGGSCRPDFEQAWAVERILEAARRSQLSRAWVDLADVD